MNDTNIEKMGSLKGQLLIAMPGMEDDRFARTVILISSHDDEGAMGFVLNRPLEEPTFGGILDELKLRVEGSSGAQYPEVFRGGPVEIGRGFVIHSLDYTRSSSSRIGDVAAVTATLDILRAIETEQGPDDAIMALGYSGWDDGQLEDEIASNGWLTLPATSALLFETPYEQKYDAALATIGVTEAALSGVSGTA